MKVHSPLTRVDVKPGEHVVIPLQVINTSDVIESATVSILGFDAGTLSSDPAHLPLFPEAAGTLEVTLKVPQSFPAGTYPLTLVVSGVAPNSAKGHHLLELVVPREPALRLSAAPSVVRARRKASFPVTVHNDGNVPLETALRATDTDRKLRTSVLPATVTVAPGGSTQISVIVKGPRQLLGADRERPVTLNARGVGVEADVVLALQQRSTLSRGLVTAILLIAVMALWVLAFLFGIKYVMGGDPFTKVAPASFFAGQTVGTAGAGGEAVPGASPDGALPKDGAIPAGVGATITGKVTSVWDGAGVPRLTVDVYRQGRNGLLLTSSTATLDDGQYAVAGLFPGQYYVRVSAEGYKTIWYPAASRAKTSTLVTATAKKSTDGVNLAVTGATATLNGTVNASNLQAGDTVTVKATPSWSLDDPKSAITTTADDDGTYRFTSLKAPGTYQLTFTAEGYLPVTSSERVFGGQSRYALDVALDSTKGSISGTVTDGANPIGAVTVTTVIGDKELTVGTPTVGQVGFFALPNLPTPATYVLTFTKEGFTTRSTVVDLLAGESLTDLQVRLAGGAGTVTGKVTNASGVGLGNVSVSVGGSATPISSSTLTGAAAGSFTLTGLTTPGQYTLTFSAEGYQNASVPVQLTADSPSGTVSVTLRKSMGSVQGLVTQGTKGKAGISVQITDGLAVRTTISTATGELGRGTFSFEAMPPGTYTITARNAAGRVLATAVTTVTPGKSARADLPLKDGS